MADPIRRSPSFAQRSDALGSVSRYWQRSYAPEYLGLIVILVADALIQLFVEPFHRMFALDDHAIQFPHAEVEQVPLLLLVVYGFVVPIVVLALWAVVFRPQAHKIHVTYLGLVTSIFLTVFITDFIKNAVGRPRPDLIDRCKPARDTPQHELVTYLVCTQTNHHTLHDGFRSFPSGHSSWSFSGLGFLALFLASQFHTFGRSSSALHTTRPLPALLIPLAPLLLALYIAISRCEDYRHDVYDVTVGSILGFGIAYITYRRYYPPLMARGCETPFPTMGKWDGAPPKRADLESGVAVEVEDAPRGMSLGRSMGSGPNGGMEPPRGLETDRARVGDEESDAEEDARFLRH